MIGPITDFMRSHMMLGMTARLAETTQARRCVHSTYHTRSFASLAWSRKHHFILRIYLVVASSAVPVPVAPPPMTSTSKGSFAVACFKAFCIILREKRFFAERSGSSLCCTAIERFSDGERDARKPGCTKGSPNKKNSQGIDT
jgi:hypothetical protein